MRAFRFVPSAAFVLTLSSLSLAAAEPPALINYQGVLRDAADNPLSGSFDMTFRLYDTEMGGSELLVDAHLSAASQAVVVTGGTFSTQIGGGAVSDGSGPGTYSSLGAVFRDYATVWLSIEVGAETLTPRVRIVAAAYALNADAVDGKNGADLLDSSASFQVKAGRLAVGTAGSGDAYGIEAQGLFGGAQFTDSDATRRLYAAHGHIGLEAYGNVNAGTFVNTAAPGVITVRLADTSFGIYSLGILAGGAFYDWDGTGSAEIAKGNYGMEGRGSLAGGHFWETDSAAITDVASNGYGLQANGPTAGGHFGETDSAASADVAMDGYGIKSYGSTAGGFFDHTTGTGVAELAKQAWGIESRGAGAGGYFLETDTTAYSWAAINGYGTQGYGPVAGGYFDDLDASGNAWLAHGDTGVEGYGSVSGGYFADSNNTGAASIGYGDEGIFSIGSFGGSFFDDTDSAGWTRAGYSTYKVQGSGTVSFVQNHPYDKDKVIVYAAPEGDEVAVYTRGTGKLVNGEARVRLGETFPLVANPDVGLTAHLTPRGKATDLFIESLGTAELVVRGDSDSEFDYIVWGLRIGFEQQSIVQPKQFESLIPSMADHEAIYSQDPTLRRYNALERHAAMARDARGVSTLDAVQSQQLVEAIGVYDPVTHGSVETLHHRSHRRVQPAEPAREPVGTGGESSRQEFQSAHQEPNPLRELGPSTARAEPVDSPLCASIGAAPPLFELFFAENRLEAGDVVVLDPEQAGVVRRSSQAADPHVVGCVVEAPEGTSLGRNQAAVAVSHIALCRADATGQAIAIGDLLVSAESPGHVTKAAAPAPGQILGKALEPLAAGTGLIRVLIGTH
jgi:hypothetical protein